MNPEHPSRSPFFRLLPFMLLAGLVFVIYSNSLTAAWQMDDKPNIINNNGLHIHDLMPETLWRTFFANQGKSHQRLYRPLPCLSFAFNWYLGGDNPLGYHMVNLGIHIAIAWVLYLVMLRLLTVLCCKKEGRFNPVWVHDTALLAAVLWAINPIQIQAVTYIIQRMAEMATLFYVLGILYFLKARTADGLWERRRYCLACVFWFLCGLASKENAVLLPVSLLLVEWIFFRNGRLDFMRRPKAWVIFAGLLIIGFSAAYFLTHGGILHPRRWYAAWLRPFTPEERLLTQPRVVLYYLSQIFYPLPTRLSMAHDVTVSTSLMHPWTTLPAILIVFGMCLGAVLFSRRWPLVSFAVLFFFLNHLVESSIVPLELVFEHRNYLPSLFLFMPVAAGLQWLLRGLRRDNRFVHVFLSGALIVMLAGQGLGTYTRNTAWASEKTLWLDAVSKAPSSPRPQVYLAQALAWGDNPTQADYHRALAIYRRCVDLYPTRLTARANILGDMGGVYFNMGDNEKAIRTFKQALAVDPEFAKVRSDLIKALVVTGHFTEAEHHARLLVDKRPHRPYYNELLGFILLWQDHPEKALPYFQRALANGPATGSLMLDVGITLTRLSSFKNGRWFLQMAAAESPGDLYPLFTLIENRVRAGDPDGAALFAGRLVAGFPTARIAESLKKAPQDFRSAPIAPALIAPYLKEVLQDQAVELVIESH